MIYEIYEIRVFLGTWASVILCVYVVSYTLSFRSMMHVCVNKYPHIHAHTYLSICVCTWCKYAHIYTWHYTRMYVRVYTSIHIYIWRERKEEKNSKVYVYAYTHVTCQWSWWRYCDFLLIFLLKIILGMAAISVRLSHETVHTYIYLIFNYKCLSI